MVILTGKLIYGVALESHSRFLFIPWVRSNGVIMSLKVSNFSSSIPVRYIPKNSPKPRIPLVSTPPKNDIEEQVKHKHTCLDSNVGRAESSYGTEVAKRKFSPKKSFKTENSRSLVPPVNDFHDVSRHGSPESDVLGLELGDGGKSMGGSFDVDEVLDRNHRAIVNLDFNAESETDEELGGLKSLEDSEELVHEITGKEASGTAFQPSKNNQDAENMAVRFLSRRALTKMELRKKLIAKRYPLHVVDEVINKFQIRKFLDDFQYAEAFSRSRFSSLSWGPARIKQALRLKGVSEADAEKAIKLVFKDGQSGEDQSRFGLSKSSLDQLYAQASKRWLQSQSQPVEKRKSKIIQWLQYRGFNWGVVNGVLKKLESDFPP
ncbi:hypothetical protein DCAR_0417811 [Daucus carota subsp. sativus]|uniref:Regulatory protein RecX n=1 Tax=Daucus carota subsp. sativus TaxID=79200 RepID=A0AAF0X171_DAUCS|nr:PREDICTED: regulatory protein RecX [Daucus carota subsp. sativus]WOG98468.1 hypothetical protein DCAR_0417811 [Daucus carota subsp. sativus]